MDTTEPAPGSSADGAPAPESYEQRFDAFVGRTLETAAAAGALLFLFFALLHPLLFDPPASYALAVVALATAAVAGTVWWWTRGRRLSPGGAHAAITVGLGAILIHTVAAAGARPAPEMTFWFALVGLAAGVLVLSWRWFGALVAGVVVAWGFVAWRAPPDPGWLLHGPFVLLASIVLGGVTLASRRRIYRDLVDREESMRQANRELDQARWKAERAENLQARFLANVSHDVRTPASAIIEEARHLRADATDEDEREQLAMIEDHARHLVRLFDDILDVSMAEAGQLSIRDEAFPLERLVRQSLDTVATQAEEKGLEIALGIRDGVPAIVRTDPHRLRQILTNLLSNAVKFTPEGSVEVTAEVEGREPLLLRFEVEDTGIGIPEERQEELFRAFSRIEAAPDVEGTGLGLAICKRLTKLLGGEIGVESREGEGSTFWFTLPVEAASPGEIEETSGPVRLSGRTAWLVGTEGAPASRLDLLGFQVERMAGIGIVEQALADDRRPSLIVLDLLTIRAPEDFLAERVRSWRGQDVPVILTKAPGTEIAELEEIPGPGAVITPSLAEEELREIVSRCLREAGGSSPLSVSLDPGMAERHPLSILVVEDSPVNRRLLRGTLERLGYEPDGAADAEEALERVGEREYDLVFLDLGLPGMSGLELAQRVRRELEDPPRIVALTGYTDEETTEKARQVGLAAHLAKPVDLQDVVDQLEQTPSGGAPRPDDADDEPDPSFSEEG